MSDRPIIFSAPMVLALLAGRKTQTRRLLKPGRFAKQCGYEHLRLDVLDGHLWWWDGVHDCVGASQPFPYAPGDRLWVREGFVTGFDIDDEMGRPIGNRKVWYRATDAGLTWYDPDTESTLDNPPWKPSIFMPRRFSRLTLTVADVRVQRVQEISRGDAMDEGCPFPNMATGQSPCEWFRDLWTGLHGPASWGANPWVVALTFTVQHGNIDAVAPCP